jgi:hypothetical protein
MKKLWIVDIENIPMRYSTQWRKWIPNMLKDSFDVHTISGQDYVNDLTSGGFFNFDLTNAYKANQVHILSKHMNSDQIQNGDIFLFTDAWHFGVIALKYMLDLKKFNDCKIYGIFHAGAYDKTDILGRFDLGRWCDGFEESLVKACNKIFVATRHHKNVLCRSRKIDKEKIEVSGLPFNFGYVKGFYDPETTKKENIIVFPHRISPDKQPGIFKDLTPFFESLGYETVITYDLKLPKHEYYSLLAKSKFIFSAALHENWGITIFEGLSLGCWPILPNRLSYREMYLPELRYPSSWTIDMESYEKNKEKFKRYLKNKLTKPLQNNIIEHCFNYVKSVHCSIDTIKDSLIHG